MNNKRPYYRKAKPREFAVQDLVYMYNPALKPGLTRKFAKPWIGPCQITKKISELNYEIVDEKGRRQVLHINRLKKSYNPKVWNPTAASICNALNRRGQGFTRDTLSDK